MVHSIGSNLTIGIGEMSVNTDVVSNGSHYNSGRDVGDVVSMIMGVAKGVEGGSQVVAGIAGAPETAGVSLTASVVGGTQVAHGIAIIGTAANSLSSQKGRVNEMSSSGNSSGGGKNAKHSNQKAIESAAENYSDAKSQYDELKSKANKTPEDKKAMNAAKKRMDHWKDK